MEEKRKRGRPRKNPLPIIEEPIIEQKQELPKLTQEEAQMMEATIDLLVEEIRLDEDVAIKIAQEYVTLTKLAEAIRAGVDFGIEDDKKKAKMRLIGLSH